MRWFPHATTSTIAERLAALKRLRDLPLDHEDQQRIGHRLIAAAPDDAKVRIPTGWKQKVASWKRRA